MTGTYRAKPGGKTRTKRRCASQPNPGRCVKGTVLDCGNGAFGTQDTKRCAKGIVLTTRNDAFGTLN